MSRIAEAFSVRRGRTGLIPFLTAGYPSLDGTLDLLSGLERLGVLGAEIGVPFSDPIADGPEIQRASEWALKHRVSASEVLDLVARYRRSSNLPIVLMSYANPILRVGFEAFAQAARAAGVDGLILSDLPPEESPEVWQAFDRAGLDTIVLVAPTTAPDRLPLILQRCRGFVYCLARTGVTGRAAGDPGVVSDRIALLRRHTRLPIAVGFGISSGEQARGLRGLADAVVVGAALMRAVAEDPARDGPGRALALARELIDALS